MANRRRRPRPPSSSRENPSSSLRPSLGAHRARCDRDRDRPRIACVRGLCRLSRGARRDRRPSKPAGSSCAPSYHPTPPSSQRDGVPLSCVRHDGARGGWAPSLTRVPPPCPRIAAWCRVPRGRVVAGGGWRGRCRGTWGWLRRARACVGGRRGDQHDRERGRRAERGLVLTVAARRRRARARAARTRGAARGKRRWCDRTGGDAGRHRA